MADVTYPAVERGHILPEVYQRNWASEKMVELHVVGRSGSRRASTKDVGVIRRAYRRERPDGTAIDDIEWSLSHIEGAVQPILTDVAGRWPLSFDDKKVLAEFLAVQMIRGPRWWRDREKIVRQAVADYRIDGLEDEHGNRRGIGETEAERATAVFLGS